MAQLRKREIQRLGAVVAAAVLTGGAAVVAMGENEAAEPTQLASQIRAEAAAPAGADGDENGAGALAFGRDGGAVAAPSTALDGTTSTDTTTADGTSTSEAASTSVLSVDDDTTTSTDGSTTSTGDDTTSSTSATSSTGSSSTTDRSGRTTTTTGGDTTSTTRATTSTTRATTSTTRATTSTTRATTTTTRPTTTTTRATTTTAGNSCASGAEFELIMRDDFNGSSIGGQWLVWDQDTGNAGNGRRMADQLSVSNGRLLLEAEMVNGTLHSGGMNHTHAQTYGRYTFRVRTDVDPSRTMSGVILTWPTSDNHLRDGENNAYETLPHQDSPTRNPFYSFIHKPFASNAGQQEYKIWQADAAQWQTITMEWTPSRISITRGGGETWTVNETGSDLIPDVPHRFHIQLDAFGSSISNRVTMEVDYAEVYRYCG